MEINAYMNGYKPETDIKFLTESLEAHKQEVKRLKGILKTLNVVCDNCGFEYHKQHEVDTPGGGYSCPLCELQEAHNEIITAKEFLYQHIQTNKELEMENENIKKSVEQIIGEETLWQNGIYESEMSKLRQKVCRLEKFYTYFSELYGQNLQIANWHQNGDLEPFDKFFDSAEEEIVEEPSETHTAAHPELYFEK